MATATMRENSISRKTTEPRTANPRTPLIGLRDFVQRRYPHEYRLTCDYLVEGRTILRAKRFLGTIVDKRPIGEIPDGMEAVKIFVEDFNGIVLGEPDAIQRITQLENEFWHVSNSIASMFTAPACPSIPPSFPTSRLERGLV